MDQNQCEAWEQAYLKQSHDAAIGRLFKGLIHNLNGVAQAFSMQTEVLGMLFDQAPALIEAAGSASNSEETADPLAKLTTLIARRAGMIGQMAESVATMQKIMRRTCTAMEESRDQSATQPYTMRSVVESEIEFMKANGFFKHKVEKNLLLAASLPPLRCLQVEIHQIFYILLENAVDALQNQAPQRPVITVESVFEGDDVHLVVSDNGPGIAEAEREGIFSPFVSGKDGHDGVGLYLARKIAAGFEGQVTLDTAYNEGARFVLTFPGARAVCGG